MGATTVSSDFVKLVPKGGTYLPAIPPRTPKSAAAYTKSVLHAPQTALAGVVIDGRDPTRRSAATRDRERKIVGSSNRWRLPYSLGSDLLGMSQATRACNQHINHTMMNIMTAENPRLMVNIDMTQPYEIHSGAGRSVTPMRYSSMQDDEQHFFFEPPPSTTPKECNDVPSTARNGNRIPRPIDVFRYHSRQSRPPKGPDVLLRCLGINWELHRPVLQKSETLSELLEQALESPGPTRYYRTRVNSVLDDLIKDAGVYSNEYQETARRLNHEDQNHEVPTTSTSTGESQNKAAEGCPPLSTNGTCEKNADVTTPGGAGSRRFSTREEQEKHTGEERVLNHMTVIEFCIDDTLVTQHALAVALGNLYHDHLEVSVDDVAGVFAASNCLKIHSLQNSCAHLMLNTMNSRRICSYYNVAQMYEDDRLQSACEHWLELNLVPKMLMTVEVSMRHIPMDLLQKILTSNKLFTTSEFALFKVVAIWLFLQLNPQELIMPCYAALNTYYNSLPKGCSLLQREEGQSYISLFKAIRLHGITDTNQLQDIQTMNIVPQSWLVDVLSNHYHSLQSGGDMISTNNFHNGCVRQGFVLQEVPHFHSEIFSLHGFHFELKSVRQELEGAYCFYMQRLKPSDPVLSFRQCERHTFSMRPDRDVRYSIRVQWFDAHNNVQTYNTGMLTHRFGLRHKTSKSEIVQLEDLKTPIYVTFALLFPSS